MFAHVPDTHTCSMASSDITLDYSDLTRILSLYKDSEAEGPAACGAAPQKPFVARPVACAPEQSKHVCTPRANRSKKGARMSHDPLPWS